MTEAAGTPSPPSAHVSYKFLGVAPRWFGSKDPPLAVPNWGILIDVLSRRAGGNRHPNFAGATSAAALM
jgi:hypothetical protein